MSVDSLVELVQVGLRAAAVPEDAAPMQAYMKTDMPFYGVKKTGRLPIERQVKRWPSPDVDTWRAGVDAVWALPHREEKYLAIALARLHPEHHSADILPWVKGLVENAAWWDLVDELAIRVVGSAWARDRARVEVEMDRWIDDPDVWVRRTAIIGQLKHKADTDAARMFAYCRARQHEQVFWIRKGIGWALREHSKTDPDAVSAFLVDEWDGLSGLTRREAVKHMVRQGQWPPAGWSPP